MCRDGEREGGVYKRWPWIKLLHVLSAWGRAVDLLSLGKM